jgi:glutamine synthetase
MKEFGSHAEDYLIQQGDRSEHIYEKFRTKLRDSGVAVESMKGEASIGQHEINIAFNEPVNMSDSVLVLKSVKFNFLFLVSEMHCGPEQHYDYFHG